MKKYVYYIALKSKKRVFKDGIIYDYDEDGATLQLWRYGAFNYFYSNYTKSGYRKYIYKDLENKYILTLICLNETV